MENGNFQVPAITGRFNKTKLWKIIFISIISIIIIVLAFFSVYFLTPRKSDLEKELAARQILLNNLKVSAGKGQNYSLGTSTPKVILVEFADFACPYCRSSFRIARELGFKYQNDARIIFRDLPVHENSLDLSLAARCAGEQGLFWEMHDRIFSAAEIPPTELLPELANIIGADTAKYSDCVSQQRYLADIQKDLTDAETLGITGTPTWVINGIIIPGEASMSELERVINFFLSQATSTPPLAE